MIYSRSAEYAVRAVTHLAGLAPLEFAMAKTIAKETGVPAHFLAKLLQDLARDGFLKSSKGPGGGFRLAQAAEEISLLRIVEAVDGAGRYDRCPAGLERCDDKALCGMHDAWMELRGRIIGYLGGTSFAQVNQSLVEKRKGQSRARSTQRAKGSGKAASNDRSKTVR